MSGRIPPQFIEELIARADIVDVIGSRVPLKKGGKEFKACCPFHDEKSASFTVVPDKQFYHCFGCGAHGTALGFLMEYEHLSFVEAVEDLAARVGLTVPREEDPNAKQRPSEDLYLPLERAVELYRQQLKTSDRAIQYLKKRGLTGDTAHRFCIGYAPDAWDFISSSLATSEAENRQLLQVGLTIEREQRSGAKSANQRNGQYDRFRDRIMFPIRDSRGRTIGFGGRILDQGEPKYLNSPETELFHKGRELYGLFEARQSTRNLKRLLVVEGYMDVVRLHQAGITYAVATLGTATTPEHLTRIFRVCTEVVFCFDGDRAGRAAAWRALENALPLVREGRQIRFLFLPDGHDPDSLVGEEGPAAFEARFDKAESLSDYFIRELASRSDIATVDGRAQLAEAAKPLLHRIPPGVYRELLQDALAKVVGMAPERLMSLLEAGDSRNNRSDTRHSAQSEMPRSNLAATFGADDESSPNSRTAAPSTGRKKLVRQAIRALVHFPQTANAITDPTRLVGVNQPGIPLLVELLSELQSTPCQSMAALLERWREKPDHIALSRLASIEYLVTDVSSAARELVAAVERLITEDERERQFNSIIQSAVK